MLRLFPRPFRCRTAAAALLCVIPVLPLASCASGQKLGKAAPAKQTVYIQSRKDLKADPPGSTAFHVSQRTTDAKALKSASTKPALKVMPVDLGKLKVSSRSRKKMTPEQYAGLPVVQRIAGLMQTRFQQEADRYAAPAKGNHLQLELALTEFRTTSSAGNVVKTAAGFFIGPFSAVASPLTNGIIAIEGRVKDPATGRIVYQFADRESDPVTLFSVRSFQSTAFAEIIVGQWAAQLPKALRGVGKTSGDSSFLRLNPF